MNEPNTFTPLAKLINSISVASEMLGHYGPGTPEGNLWTENLMKLTVRCEQEFGIELPGLQCARDFLAIKF